MPAAVQFTKVAAAGDPRQLSVRSAHEYHAAGHAKVARIMPIVTDVTEAS